MHTFSNKIVYETRTPGVCGMHMHVRRNRKTFGLEMRNRVENMRYTMIELGK